MFLLLHDVCVYILVRITMCSSDEVHVIKNTNIEPRLAGGESHTALVRLTLGIYIGTYTT
jgi:hypothetical protein